MTKNKDFERGEVQKLKERLERTRSELRRQKKKNKELISKLETLEAAWKKTEDFLHDLTLDVPLEELLKYKTLPKRAVRKRTKREQKPKEDPRDKWADFVKKGKHEEMD